MSKIAHYFHLLREQIVRDPLSPKRVAAGWALGMFVGCSIPFGLQLLVSVPLAIAFRVSKIGATVGTLLTNPITIWFIYPAQTWVAHRLLFGDAVSYEQLDNLKWTWEVVSQLGFEIMTSFFVGGLLLALICTPITYFVVHAIVVRFRRSKS